MLISVDAPHFNAGIVVENDKVVKAAPILQWTVGKDGEWLRAYFKRKGWTVVVCRKSKL